MMVQDISVTEAAFLSLFSRDIAQVLHVDVPKHHRFCYCCVVVFSVLCLHEILVALAVHRVLALMVMNMSQVFSARISVIAMVAVYCWPLHYVNPSPVGLEQ